MKPCYTFDAERFRLGSLCRRGHRWNGQEQSLRYSRGAGACVECKRLHDRKYYQDPKNKERQQAAARERYEQDPAYRRRAKERSRKRYLDPVGKELHRAYQKKRRKDPTVKQYMKEYQRSYYSDPEKRRAKLEAEQRRCKDPRKIGRIRIVARESCLRRRARLARVRFTLIKPEQKLRRWAEFDDCCAYCGAAGKMEVDHWIPINKGGAHALDNILPACRPCNRNKSDRNPEGWYRSRSYFSEDRLNKIYEVLGASRPAHAQVSLFELMTGAAA